MRPSTSTKVIAIDPGNHESAYVVIDTSDYRPRWIGKLPNLELLHQLTQVTYDRPVIEQIGHYGTGMPAGRDVFDTCRWIGRFEQHLADRGYEAELVLRPTVKTHICGTPKAKDPNVTQALVDRFAPGQPNYGKGAKTEPGFFYGFHRDIWAAFALAVYAADQIASHQP